MSGIQKYKGHTIEIKHDDNPESPREWENICIFHIAHSKYSFGDENYQSFQGIETARNKAIRNRDIVLPLYMYDHGGITISLTPFSCPFDSGQVGFVSVPRKRMLSEYSKKIFTPKLKARALEIVEHELATLDSFLRGEVYGYTVDDEDSCWGFYGEEDAIAEAKGEIDYTVKDNTIKHYKKIKMWIKNHVPLYARTALEA